MTRPQIRPRVRLSVDFGTSNTVAALGLPDGRVRPLLFDGSPTLPSSVFLDPAGGLLVGRDAVHSARTSPDRFEPNPKRRVDEHAVLLGDAEVPVVDLITAVLSRVAGEARRVAGGPIDAVTLTHPAAWAQTRRRVLVDAANRAGLPPTALVPEPVAAADSFLAVSGDAVPLGACVVVYDLGAGTFDASVVRRTPGGFDVIAAEGLNQAGGLDIDAAVTSYLGAHLAGNDGGAFARLLSPTTTEERRANRLLWEDVRNAKELLSRATRTQVHVPLVGVDVPLGREQFELLARPILDATVNATRAAVNSAQVRPADVAGIFLVGGGSRIPLVSTLLSQAFGRTPTATEQPELVVAEGGLRAAGAHAGPAHAGPAHAGPAHAGPAHAGPAAGGPVAAGAASPASPYQGPATPVSGFPAAEHAPPNPVSAAPVSPYQPPTGQPHPGQHQPTGQPSPGQPSPGQPSPGQPSPGQHQPGTHQPGTHQPGTHQPTGQYQPPIPQQYQPPTHQTPPPTNQFQPATGHFQPPTPPGTGGRTTRRRNLVIAAGVAVVLVVVLGAAGVWALFRDKVVDVDRQIYAENGRTVTLVNMTVDGDRVRLNFLYRNGSRTSWSLSCRLPEVELRSSYLVVGRNNVYPVKTRCSAEEPRGRSFSLAPGNTLESYGVFPAPDEGTTFAVQWYSFPRAGGLTL
ncbi:Hsp70 family protein [Virgisporangium ochraceum]|uniref:Hsp70 family protein n=1 Tax=Virgisporangium ochraceum TaxID=65505 RepID=UPI0019455B77|nr:Hsp70 family protein [Virgisporangium ochraceum]